MIAAAALLGVATAVSAQKTPDPSWLRVLWLHGGPPRDARFFEAVRRLGFNAVSVSGEEDPAVPGRHGLRFYRDQVAGKGVLELREAPWRTARDGYEKSRQSDDLRRPECLAEDATIAVLREVLKRRLDAAVGERPLAVSLGDEISVTRHADPLDFCFRDGCLRQFRAFLAARYGSVGSLNLAWGSDFVSLDVAVPFTADRIRARELQGGGMPRNLKPWSEHLEFKDRQLADVVRRLQLLVGALAPGLPVGLTGMQPPSAYGGHDYRLLMRGSTFYEAYDIGGARDLAQCLAPAGAVAVQTLFAPAADEPIELVRARCFDLLAHGMAGLVAWSAGSVFGADGTPSPFGEALAAAFEELGPAAAAAAGAAQVRSPVWLVESQASVRAHWMIDSIADGRTWIRRLSSYEAEHSTSLAARRSWIRLLEDLGFQPRLVPAEELPSALRAESPALLILPALLAISDATADAVVRYVEAGGTALADHGLALYDEHLARRAGGALDQVFGLRDRSYLLLDHMVRQGVPSERGRLPRGAAAAEARLRGDLAEPVGDFQVQIENTFGAGRTVYLNLAVCEYARVRLDPARHHTAVDLRQRVRRVVWATAARPPVLIAADGLPTCIERMPLRARDGRRLIAVRVNALDDLAMMRQIGARGPRKVELSFPQPTALRDLVSGRRSARNRQHEMLLDPWTGLLLELTR